MSTNWYNSNEVRNYPIHEECSPKDSTGDTLHPGILCDLSLLVPDEFKGGVYVSSVTVTNHLVSIAIAARDVPIAVCTVRSGDHTLTGHAVTPLVPGVTGFVVFGTASHVYNGGRIRMDGTLATARVADRCIRYTTGKCVSSLRSYHGDGTKLTGIVDLLPGNNVTIRNDGNTIYVGLEAGKEADFLSECDRTGGFKSCGELPPLRTINGVGPDNTGTIILEVNNGV